MTMFSIGAAIRDPSVVMVLPAFVTFVFFVPAVPVPVPVPVSSGQRPVVIILETLGLQFRRIFDGMITVNDDFSSFWKLTVIVELPFDRNFFLQMLKWCQKQTWQ